MHSPTTTAVNSPTTPTNPNWKTDGPRFSHHENHEHYTDDEHDAPVPTTIGRYRQFLRPYLAEFVGTMFLVLFGIGGNCQVGLSNDPNVSSPHGDYVAVGFAFGVGISLGAWVSGAISGGHINPAVTIAMATFRGFSWRKVPGYVFSQLMGGLIGAAIVYANYFHAIDIYEGGSGVRTLKTAGYFGTIPLDYMTNVSAFFSEFLGAAILIFVIFCATDAKNGIPATFVPPILFVVLLGIAFCFGMETSFGINPARDLGPRLLTSMVGYGGAVYSIRHQWWLWGGVMAPILGGLCGAFFYDILLYGGTDGRLASVFNRRTQHQADSPTASV